MEQTNKDCRFRNFDNFPTPTTFACWKIRFKTEVCTCSQFPTEAMRWIKEVEMVESVDDLKSSRSIREFLVQTLSYSTREMLQHWTKSSIILTSKERSVRRNKRSKSRTVSSEEDRSLTWSTSFSRSQEPTILSRTMPTYSLLIFEMMIFRNSIQSGMEFHCLWRKSHLMTSWNDCTN